MLEMFAGLFIFIFILCGPLGMAFLSGLTWGEKKLPAWKSAITSLIFIWLAILWQVFITLIVWGGFLVY